MLCNVYVESHVVSYQFYFHDSFRIHSETQRYKSFKSHRLSEHKFWSSFKKSKSKYSKCFFSFFRFIFPKFIWVSQVRIFCSMFSSMFFEFFCLCNFTFNFVRGMAEKCWLQLLSFCCDSASANKKMVQKVASLAPPNVLVKLACACAMISSVSCFWLGTFTMAQKTKK